MSARELAVRLGLRRNGREFRGRCPVCSYADSFVLGDGERGVVGWCASCGDRDAIWAVIRGPGALPSPRPRERDAAQDAQSERDAQRKLERLTGLWDEAMPVPDSPAAVYLASRGLEHLITCQELRYSLACPHPNGTIGTPVRLPAMIAAVRSVEGALCAIHRTFLLRDGTGKADIEPAKASLGFIKGGAVRLAVAGAGDELLLAEGIETAASAGLLKNLPAWSAVSAGNLAKWCAVPAAVRGVVIAADHDAPDERGRCPGQAAAKAAAARFREEGRMVRVVIPNADGRDFNDVLLAREGWS